MTREELERRLESAEKQMLGLNDEIQNLKAKLAEQDNQEIPDSPTFEVNGGDMWFMNLDLKKTHCNTEYASAGDFNSFHTREYAEESRRKCLMIAIMLHCKWYVCRTHEPNWDKGSIQKWTVVYSHNEEKFTVEVSRLREWSTIYFDTEENAQKCANWLNAHWKESTDE